MRRALLLVVFAACSKGSQQPPDPNEAACHHYAKLFRDCHIEAKQDDPVLAQDTAMNMCLKGMSGRYEATFGPKYRAMIECSKSAETCDALDKCELPDE